MTFSQKKKKKKNLKYCPMPLKILTTSFLKFVVIVDKLYSGPLYTDPQGSVLCTQNRGSMFVVFVFKSEKKIIICDVLTCVDYFHGHLLCLI